jgi:hypothetical protein
LTPKQQIYKEKKDLKMEALQIVKPDKERARNVDTKKPTLLKMLDGYPQVHVSEFNCLDTTNGFVFRMRRRNWWPSNPSCRHFVPHYPCGLNANKATKKQVQLIQHLDKLVEAGHHTERGKSHPVFMEDSTGCLKCLCLGCKAVQGGSGRVLISQVPGVNFDGKGPFPTMVAVTQNHMANYICAGELVGVKHTQEIVCPDGTISLGNMITKFLCAGGCATVAKTAVLYGTTCFVPEALTQRTLQS